MQGAVVVWVTLDDDGRVTAATAVSGPKVLVESAVANARTWCRLALASFSETRLYNSSFTLNYWMEVFETAALSPEPALCHRSHRPRKRSMHRPRRLCPNLRPT